MHPDIQIFSFNIKAYSLFLLLALIAVTFGSIIFASKRNLDLKKVVFIIISAGVAAIIGARLLNIIINFNLYLTNSERIFIFKATGFSLFGGILFAILIVFLLCKFLKVNFWRLGDSIAPFLGFGIALMRIGCFLNGCCYGKETNLPWGVHFPNLDISKKLGISTNPLSILANHAVHPTQIYELIAALIGSAIAIYCIRKKYTDGVAILIFGIWFTFFRLINMHFRVMPKTFDAPEFFYPVLYLATIIILITLLLIRTGKLKIAK